MNVGVIGASGYAGGELLRFLALHPEFEPVAITAHSNAGELITAVHPQLQSYRKLKFTAFNASDFLDCELIFIALPHGESAKIIHELPPQAKIVDLGADYRLHNSDSWLKYYGGTHAGTWTYGLAEVPDKRSEICAATKVANPGCYASAIALGAIPAASFADLSDIVVVAASGTTGAGRSAKVSLIASEIMGSLSSYKFGGAHQHIPEIEETISAATQQDVHISFTPILAPMPRGILATITAKCIEAISTTQAHAIFTDFYKNDQFLSVLPLGTMPKTSSVIGSNRVQMQVAIDEHVNRVVISVVIDNLGKGAAGQAIQNANLMCGFDETLGLLSDGVGA